MSKYILLVLAFFIHCNTAKAQSFYACTNGLGGSKLYKVVGEQSCISYEEVIGWGADFFSIALNKNTLYRVTA